MKYIVLTCFLLACSGCAVKMSPAAARIQEADSHFVRESNCKYVKEVHGVAGFTHFTLLQGIEDAKSEAREQAAEKGATHIVWTDIKAGEFPFVSGKAYLCK